MVQLWRARRQPSIPPASTHAASQGPSSRGPSAERQQERATDFSLAPPITDIAALGGAPSSSFAALPGLVFARQRPSQQQFTDELLELRDRDVKLFFAYFGLETA